MLIGYIGNIKLPAHLGNRLTSTEENFGFSKHWIDLRRADQASELK